MQRVQRREKRSGLPMCISINTTDSYLKTGADKSGLRTEYTQKHRRKCIHYYVLVLNFTLAYSIVQFIVVLRRRVARTMSFHPE